MNNKPGDIITGKILYPITDYVNDFRGFINELNSNKEKNEGEKNNTFKRLFMFVLLSSLDKKEKSISTLLGIPEDKIVEGQELFKREIDVLRAIWMAKFIEIMKSHLVNDGMVLKLLNADIQLFLKSLFPEEYKNDSPN